MVQWFHKILRDTIHKKLQAKVTNRISEKDLRNYDYDDSNKYSKEIGLLK